MIEYVKLIVMGLVGFGLGAFVGHHQGYLSGLANGSEQYVRCSNCNGVADTRLGLFIATCHTPPAKVIEVRRNCRVKEKL